MARIKKARAAARVALQREWDFVLDGISITAQALGRVIHLDHCPQRPAGAQRAEIALRTLALSPACNDTACRTSESWAANNSHIHGRSLEELVYISERLRITGQALQRGNLTPDEASKHLRKLQAGLREVTVGYTAAWAEEDEQIAQALEQLTREGEAMETDLIRVVNQGDRGPEAIAAFAQALNLSEETLDQAPVLVAVKNITTTTDTEQRLIYATAAHVSTHKAVAILPLGIALHLAAHVRNSSTFAWHYEAIISDHTEAEIRDAFERWAAHEGQQTFREALTA